jgi:hypothetical protein
MKNYVKGFENHLNESRINETYKDLLHSMEVFQEPLNDLSALVDHLRALRIEGVDSRYINENYAEPANQLLLELDRLKRSFMDDESLWQRKGRFREDSERRTEEMWKRMADVQAENERRYRGERY